MRGFREHIPAKPRPHQQEVSIAINSELGVVDQNRLPNRGLSGIAVAPGLLGEQGVAIAEVDSAEWMAVRAVEREMRIAGPIDGGHESELAVATRHGESTVYRCRRAPGSMRGGDREQERGTVVRREVIASFHEEGSTRAQEGLGAADLGDCDRVSVVKFSVTELDKHCVLPGLGGFEAISELQQDEATRFIPIVALTAFGTWGDDEHIRAAGCVGYITTPMAYKDVLAAIAKHSTRH